MTGSTLALLIAAAGIILLAFIPGHALGRRSRRFDYPRGWDAGLAAERERWEAATGTTLDALAAWNVDRSGDEEWEAWLQNGEPPSKEVLFRTAELDQMAAEYEARRGPAEQEFWRDLSKHGPHGLLAAEHAPVVADITSAARWRPPGWDEVPVIDGRVVTRERSHDPSADWDLLAGSALPAYAAAALAGDDGRPRTVDECVDSIAMRAVRS